MSLYNRIYKFVEREKVDEILLISLFLFASAIIMQKEKKPNEVAHKQLMYGDLTYGVFSETRLADYNGIKEEKLYLAVLGSVFDVSKGAKYYAKGGSYHYFVGKYVELNQTSVW